MNLYNPQYPKAREMPRSFDVTFYRILWVTLIALGLTFTVILTSVFVDIDELLAKRTHVIQKPIQPEPIKPKLPIFEEVQDFQPNDSDDMDASYRTKRSLESSNLLFHIRSPKMKKMITNRLATLLEELDEESNTNNELKNKVKNGKFLSAEDLIQKREETQQVKDDDKLRREMNSKDIFHLAMHNILLQGIIGHMDLNDVYNKAHLLVKSFDNADNTAKETQNLLENKPKELMKIISQDSFVEQDKFLDELLKCQKLQKQISQNNEVKKDDKNGTIKDSPIVINTVIEITNKMMNEKHINSDKHIKGLVKLIYNGNPIQLKDVTENINVDTNTVNEIKEKQHIFENTELTDAKSNARRKTDKSSDLNQAIEEYIKTHAIKLQNNNHLLTKENFETKRLKRQIKIHYLNDGVTTEKSKLKEKLKKHEEELFVEIETHFDGKGKNGEKKKKLVRSLIDKIQKAINSNIEVLQQENKNDKDVQIKKRTQNPIEHKEVQKEVVTPTVEPIEHRHLNPISKTANVMQPLTSVLDKHGENWKRTYDGPGFLTVSKSLNSAEMSEVDVDYSSVMRNGIPKRLQTPLNTENEGLISQVSSLGNVTLFLKEIGGSGFSIGINQYTDSPPDKDSLKMFTGLENLIQAYHEQYDQTDRDALGNSEDLSNTDNYERRDRRKRGAFNVKLFSNLKTKTRLNRFLNTNAMQTKKIFLKSKRNKRHIDKIRIVASDHYPRSKEVVLVSHEDIFADRAVIKEEPPEVEIGDREERYDFIAPYENPYSSNMPNFQPYLGIYDTHSLHNGLMSKYPHIFVENISKSKEIVNIHPMNTENDDTEAIKTHEYRKFDTETRIHANDRSIESNMSAPNVDEIVNAVLPQSNYKLTVNILPKNKTNMGPGYKEVHTSINKSYDKNGIRYVSSVNVSEISKFESLNKTKEDIRTKFEEHDKDEQHENQIKLLLKLHKVRIDNQLENLKMESRKLKQLIGKDDKENWMKNISSIIDVFKHLGLKIFDEKVTLTKPNSNYTMNQENSLQISTTRKPFIENRQDKEKSNLINIIKENGNITREILQKIDKNTDILQSFLQKVSDKISREAKIVTETPNYLRIDPISPIIEHLHRNYTNSIPFIYAIQKPIQSNEKFKNTASVVYHGHLHTNGLENGNYPKDIKNDVKTTHIKDVKDIDHKLSNNETRFFIDDLESDFKLVPNVNNLHTIRINTTIL